MRIVLCLLLTTIVIQKLFYCSRLTVPKCDLILCESMPDDLTYVNTAMSTIPIWRVWKDLIMNSTKSIKITSYYWTLLNDDVNPNKNFSSSEMGKMIFDLLDNRSKVIPLEIIQNYGDTQSDLVKLQKNELVKVHIIDNKRLLSRGIQHSKVWIGDDSRAFIGSANMDWRSLTQVKELGVYIPDCEAIVSEVTKFWLAFQLLSGPNATIPKQWPQELFPQYNYTHPLIAYVNGVLSRVYIASSPPAFNPPHRTDDLTAILYTMTRANKYICVSVMDMFPLIMGYGRNADIFWPAIENEIKNSAIDRNVTVKLLISWWRHSQTRMLEYLRSIKALSKIAGVHIEVKIFIVPAFNEDQREIPFSRVSHSKYMVTDNTAYIGTSNWSGDYFYYTGGLSLVTEEINAEANMGTNSLRKQLKDIFDSDWYSIYAHDLW